MLEPLAEVFGILTDSRNRLGKRYDLKSVLTVIFLGILSGENSERGIADWAYEQRWSLSRELGLKAGRVPRLGTIQRVLRTLNVEELEEALSAWVQPLLTSEEREKWEGIAIDGKTLRGSGSEERASLQLLSAFSHRLEVVVGQRPVADKTNEIPEARTLIKTLTLEGKLVTADALHTQRDTASAILETSLDCQVAKAEIREEKSLKRKKSYRRADTNLKASVAKGYLRICGCGGDVQWLSSSHLASIGQDWCIVRLG
jgi:hypothetical protein